MVPTIKTEGVIDIITEKFFDFQLATTSWHHATKQTANLMSDPAEFRNFFLHFLSVIPSCFRTNRSFLSRSSNLYAIKLTSDEPYVFYL